MQQQNLCRKAGRALLALKELATKVAARFNPLFVVNALVFLMLAILFAGRMAS